MTSSKAFIANLDEVRGQLLGTKPLPSLWKVFAKVRREESRKQVMLQEVVGPGASSALLSTKREDPPKEKQRCEYRNRPYHTKDT